MGFFERRVSGETAYKHLKKLEEAGYVEKEGSTWRARGIRLTEKGWEAVGEMPLLGRIAAGRGLEAVAVGDEAYSLAAELLGSRSGRSRYLLRVVGQSIIGAYIQMGTCSSFRRRIRVTARSPLPLSVMAKRPRSRGSTVTVRC